MNLNKAMIIGNLTRDPELRQTTGGQSVCSLSIATNRSWKNQQGEKQEQVEYHNIVAWGRLGEICAQYLQKGRKAYFDGRLQTRDWEGQDGIRRYRTEVVAENMIMLDGRGRPANDQGGSQMPATAPAPASAPQMKDAPAPNPEEEIQLEDIPF